MNVELKVFTLNCWGIPFISNDRKARIKAIADIFATGKFDVVCLQEVWSKDDFELLLNKSKDVLPYGHYFHSGVIGSGVCILSKFPILETFFYQWPVNGYIHKLQHGDWFGGKGVGLCRLKVNEFFVNVYSAHFHAEYNRILDEYRVHRVLQSFGTAQFIRLTSGNAHAVILAGDLNTEPNDLEYRLLLKSVGFKDSYLEIFDTDDKEEFYGTNECARNSYTPSKIARNKPAGKRIDYILFKSGSNAGCKVTKYCLPLPNQVPAQSFSYSDHEGVQANLKISLDPVKSPEDNEIEKLLTALTESIEVCKSSLTHLKRRKYFFYVLSGLLFLLFIATTSIDVPYSYKVLILIAKILISFSLFFTLLMSLLWDPMETNATIAGINSMEILLMRTKEQLEMQAMNV